MNPISYMQHRMKLKSLSLPQSNSQAIAGLTNHPVETIFHAKILFVALNAR